METLLCASMKCQTVLLTFNNNNMIVWFVASYLPITIETLGRYLYFSYNKFQVLFMWVVIDLHCALTDSAELIIAR